MSVVQGKNVIFSIIGFWGENIGDLFSERIVGCARSSTITTTTSFIKTTTAGSGKGATYAPLENNSTASLEGVVFLNEKNKVTLPRLRQFQLDQALLHASIERTDNDGNKYTDTFNFYISSLEDTGSTGDFNTFQMEMQLSGDPMINLSVPVGPVIPERFIYWRWSTLEPVVTPLLDELVFDHSAPHTQNQTMEVSLTGMPSERWFLLRFPLDETNPTTWFNTQLNNGEIPDSVFKSVETTAKWKYLKTRMQVTFDNSQTLKFSH